MKSVYFKSIVFPLTFVLCSVLFSCSSDSDNTTSANTDEFIRSSVETISFESSLIDDAVTAAKIETANTTLLVQGFSDAAASIVLIVNEYDGLGTYSLDFSEESNGTSGLYTSGTSAWSSNGGEGGTGRLTVTEEDDTEISGTFGFVGVDANSENATRTITNGVFRAKFESQ